MTIKIPTDPTDTIALGPSGSIIVEKTADGIYNQPGLPKPPAGYGRKLSFDEESMEPMYPDLNDAD